MHVQQWRRQRYTRGVSNAGSRFFMGGQLFGTIIKKNSRFEMRPTNNLRLMNYMIFHKKIPAFLSFSKWKPGLLTFFFYFFFFTYYFNNSILPFSARNSYIFLYVFLGEKFIFTIYLGYSKIFFICQIMIYFLCRPWLFQKKSFNILKGKYFSIWGSKEFIIWGTCPII